MQAAQRPRSTFPRSRRLSGRRAIEKLFKEGKTLPLGWMNLRFLKHRLGESRFGCAVRRQAQPQATQRNRMKRWLKEAFRRNQAAFPPGHDLMAVVRRIPRDLSYSQVEETLLKSATALGSSNSPAASSGTTRPFQ
ncbi:MAG: ribonuclease P protein component [Candidatus Omnitrophica bacterium]|nr:ribonuclease P protein component [Candidatus Omnitrophota bacterium]